MTAYRIGCRSMHDAAVVSGVFLVSAMVLLLAGRFLVPSVAYLDLVVQGFGGVLILFVPFILISTLLRTAHERAERRQD